MANDQVNRGETIRLKASSVTDLDGTTAITTPTITVVITRADGTTETFTTGFTELSAGNFHFDYTVPTNGPLGTYKARWSITKSNKTGVDIFLFDVVA